MLKPIFKKGDIVYEIYYMEKNSLIYKCPAINLTVKTPTNTIVISKKPLKVLKVEKTWTGKYGYTVISPDKREGKLYLFENQITQNLELLQALYT